MADKTGQRRDYSRMKTTPVEAKNRKNGKPLEVVKVGSISVPIYRHKRKL